MLLKDAKIGETCIIENIHLPAKMERRLETLGLTYGTPVTVINKKGRGTVIIRLRGTRYALGFFITRNIEVRCEHGS